MALQIHRTIAVRKNGRDRDDVAILHLEAAKSIL